MYAASIKALLPDLSSNVIQVWNPGCGKGYETFSLACILKLRYPQGRIKIWANDSDIMAIANAPNMSFNIEEVPQYMRDFMVKGRAGYGFNAAIKDSIIFEYHDVTNANALPDLDLIVCRDTLSFLPVEGQNKVLTEIQEKLKSKGTVILGDHEKLGEPYIYVGKDGISAYTKQ
jgi:purine-binding chemotaxis protein CheW